MVQVHHVIIGGVFFNALTGTAAAGNQSE